MYELYAFYAIAATALLLPILSFFLKRKHWVPKISLIGIALAFYFNLSTINANASFSVLQSNAFTHYFNLIFLTVVFLVCLASIPYERKFQTQYYMLLLLSTLGMMALAASTDLAALFIGIELTTMALYVLVSFEETKVGTEAAVKYFFIHTMSSAIILFGIALSFGITGSTKIAPLIQSASPMALASMVFLIGGFGFKLGAFPFSLWIPDVYQGAPSPITAVLAGAAKKAAFAAILLLLLVSFSSLKLFWVPIIALLSIATMLFGNLAALSQQNVKRLIAYSVIGQAGYMLMGVASANSLGISGALFQFLTHAIAVVGLFLCVQAFSQAGKETIQDYAGLGRENKFLFACFALFLFSLAGIPPLAGFVSKFLLFNGAISANLSYLAVVAIAMSAVSVYYYVRVLRSMFAPVSNSRVRTPIQLSAAIFACALLLVLFGLFPNHFIELGFQASKILIP